MIQEAREDLALGDRDHVVHSIGAQVLDKTMLVQTSGHCFHHVPQRCWKASLADKAFRCSPVGKELAVAMLKELLQLSACWLIPMLPSFA